jgi:hypothetical protein
MTSTTAGQAGALRRLIASGGLRAVYQPIVDLDTEAPVAHEALARGAQGSPLESPAALFGQAAAAGLLADLDRAARAAADLRSDEVLRGEWDVAVIGPHFAGAFVARDLGDAGPDADRRFDFFVTYERELVVAAARTLMARIVAA